MNAAKTFLAASLLISASITNAAPVALYPVGVTGTLFATGAPASIFNGTPTLR